MPTQKSWTKNGYTVNTKYAYKTGVGGENAKSTQISSVRFSKGEETDDQGYNYNYDDVGNISRVGILNDDGTWTRILDYHYDANNQLIRVDDVVNNQTIQYVYDVQGNITQRTYHPYTTATTVTSTATRTDTWTYGGRDNNVIRASTIDGVSTSYAYSYYGRPNNWTDGGAITWQNGTEIASIGDVTFTYNDGQRVSKTDADGVVTKYYYEGDRLIKMEQGDTKLFFLYDQNGLFGFDKINIDGTKSTYYYRIDARGEIVAITNGYGNVVANYTYDAWGNPISVKTSSGTTITNTSNVALLNPFRYKSYVYDNETELYYLNSRYYDPEVCRFVSRDDFSVLTLTPTSTSDKNLFNYCDNNPVMRKDGIGSAWETVFDIISLGMSIADVADDPTNPLAWLALAGDVIDVAVPFVGGVGESVKFMSKAAKTLDAVDDSKDTVKVVKTSLSNIKAASANLNSGCNTVYVSFENDVIEYVGITNDFDRRRKEWEGVRDIKRFVSDVDRTSARYVEQAVIDTFGMKKNGGLLSNKINSIGLRNPIRPGYLDFFDSISHRR